MVSHKRAGAPSAQAEGVTDLAVGSSDWLGSEPAANIAGRTEQPGFALLAICYLPQQYDRRTSILDSTTARFLRRELKDPIDNKRQK
jgi:hypothetical protein